MNYTWHIVAFFAGGAIAVQAVVNAALRGKMNHPLQAVLISFAIGTVATLVLVQASRTEWPDWEGLRTAPWWLWIGGLLGVIYVGTSMVATPQVGVALMLALGFAGQMVCSLVLDHYGMFGVQARPINVGRLAGVGLLLLGVVVLAWSSTTVPPPSASPPSDAETAPLKE